MAASLASGLWKHTPSPTSSHRQLPCGTKSPRWRPTGLHTGTHVRHVLTVISPTPLSPAPRYRPSHLLKPKSDYVPLLLKDSSCFSSASCEKFMFPTRPTFCSLTHLSSSPPFPRTSWVVASQSPLLHRLHPFALLTSEPLDVALLLH